MMNESRTKDAAIGTLLSLRDDVLDEIKDTEVSSLFSEQLIRDVFDQAWRLQFEETSAEFQHATRDLINDLLEAALGRTSRETNPSKT
jgi:hypothetical protein